MVKDSALGAFQFIIVHKLDRFARYKHELKKNGVRVLSVLENLDDSPESVILESMLEGMAEYFSKNLSREVMKGLKETALRCKHTGGIPPLGYNVAPDKTYVLNPVEAVKLIFDKYSAGYGYKPITALLKERGYKTKRGQDFTPTSLHDILKNEKYTGVYIFKRSASKVNGKRNHHSSKSIENRIRIPDGMPVIISKELFSQIRNKMGNNKFNAQNKAIEPYLLSGKIRCRICGASMIGHTSYAGRNKTKYSTYNCGERYRTKSC